MVSFIVPAHNEAQIIADTVAALHAAARGAGDPYEIVVVDDASTDGTAALARAAGTSVVSATVRHIAAARNVGGRAAKGDELLFVDADTWVGGDTVRAALAGDARWIRRWRSASAVRSVPSRATRGPAWPSRSAPSAC